MQKYICQLFICAVVALGLFDRAIALEQVNSNASLQSNIIKNPKDNRLYDSFYLDNGMQVIVVSDPDTAISAATLVVGVGAYQSPESQLGLAHYVEHMLFLGTKKHPEVNSFSKFITENSGYVNAVTNLQDTSYFFAIPNEKFDEALDYFSDYFKEPLFDATYSDKERNAINAEWSSGRADDNRIGARILALTGNPAHPFSKFPVGNLETLKDKENSNLHDELIGFYQHYYSANIMKLALVGKQSTDELKTLAKKHFESIPDKNIPLPSIEIAGLLPENLNKAIYYRPHMDVNKLILQFPAKDNSSQWNLKPNEYVQSLMISNEPGTLAYYLNEKHLADNVSFGWEVKLYGNSGTYTITFDLTKDGLKHQDDIIAATFSYLNLIREKGVNELYFSELKSRFEMNYKNDMKNDALSTANGLAHRLFEMPPKDILYAGYRFDRFDAAAIFSVLNQLTLENLRVGYVNKKESGNTPIPFYDGSYRIRNIAEDELLGWDKLSKKITLKLPAENQLLKKVDADAVKNSYDKPHKLVNKLGVEGWLMNSQYFDDKTGLMYLIVNPNISDKTVKNFVVSSLLRDLFKQKNDSLLSRYSRAGLSVNIDITDENAQYIIVSGETNKQASLIHELMQSFVTLDFSDDELKNAKNKFKAFVSNSENIDPSSQLGQSLLDCMVKNRWSNNAIIKAISAINISDIKEYQHRIITNNKMDIFAFGYFDDKAVVGVVDDILSLMGDARKPSLSIEKQFIAPVAGKKIVSEKVSSQDDNALMDFYVSPSQSPNDLADLYVINALFNNVMYTELRTKEQLAYILGSYVYNFNDYPGFGITIQSANTDLNLLKSRFDKLRMDFLNNLNNVDLPTIEQIKQSILVQLNQKPNNMQAEAAIYVGDFFDGKYDFKTKEKLINDVQSVTKTRMINTYKNIILNNNSMNIVIQVKGKKFNKTSFALVDGSQIIDGPEGFAKFMLSGKK